MGPEIMAMKIYVFCYICHSNVYFFLFSFLAEFWATPPRETCNAVNL